MQQNDDDDDIYDNHDDFDDDCDQVAAIYLIIALAHIKVRPVSWSKLSSMKIQM